MVYHFLEKPFIVSHQTYQSLHLVNHLSQFAVPFLEEVPAFG